MGVTVGDVKKALATVADDRVVYFESGGLYAEDPQSPPPEKPKVQESGPGLAGAWSESYTSEPFPRRKGSLIIRL